MQQLPNNLRARILDILDKLSINALANASKETLGLVKEYRETSGFLADMPKWVREKIFSHLNMDECRLAARVNSVWFDKLHEFVDEHPMLKAAHEELVNSVENLVEVKDKTRKLLGAMPSMASARLGLDELRATLLITESHIHAFNILSEAPGVQADETLKSFNRMFRNKINRLKVEVLSIEADWYFIVCWQNETLPKGVAATRYASHIEYALSLLHQAESLIKAHPKNVTADAAMEVWVNLAACYFLRNKNQSDQMNMLSYMAKARDLTYDYYRWYLSCLEGNENLPQRFHPYYDKLTLEKGVSVYMAFYQLSLDRANTTVKCCEQLNKKSKDFFTKVQHEYAVGTKKAQELTKLQKQAKTYAQSVIEVLENRLKKVKLLYLGFKLNQKEFKKVDFTLRTEGMAPLQYSLVLSQLERYDKFLQEWVTNLKKTKDGFAEACKATQTLYKDMPVDNKRNTHKNKQKNGTLNPPQLVITDPFFELNTIDQFCLEALTDRNYLLKPTFEFQSKLKLSAFHSHSVAFQNLTPDAKRYWLHRLLDIAGYCEVDHNIRGTEYELSIKVTKQEKALLKPKKPKSFKGMFVDVMAPKGYNFMTSYIARNEQVGVSFLKDQPLDCALSLINMAQVYLDVYRPASAQSALEAARVILEEHGHHHPEAYNEHHFCFLGGQFNDVYPDLFRWFEQHELYVLRTYDTIFKTVLSADTDLLQLATMFDHLGDYLWYQAFNIALGTNHYVLALDCIDRHIHLYGKDNEAMYQRCRIKAKLDQALKLSILYCSPYLDVAQPKSVRP